MGDTVISQFCGSMARLHKINYLNTVGGSWATAPIAGHSLTSPLFHMIAAEGVAFCIFLDYFCMSDSFFRQTITLGRLLWARTLILFGGSIWQTLDW